MSANNKQIFKKIFSQNQN